MIRRCMAAAGREQFHEATKTICCCKTISYNFDTTAQPDTCDRRENGLFAPDKDRTR